MVLFFTPHLGRNGSEGKFPRLGNMISVCIFFIKACELKYAYKLCAYSKMNVNAELKNLRG